MTKTLLADDVAIHAAMWDMMAGLDLVDALHRITQPTLVLVGEHDPSSPPAAARILAEHITASRMHVIPSASHMSPLKRPHIVNEYISRFVATI